MGATPWRFKSSSRHHFMYSVVAYLRIGHIPFSGLSISPGWAGWRSVWLSPGAQLIQFFSVKAQVRPIYQIIPSCLKFGLQSNQVAVVNVVVVTVEPCTYGLRVFV